MILDARVLEPRDLELPENVAVPGSAPPSPTDPSLIARATAARDTFLQATERLRATLPSKPEDPLTDPAPVREAMVQLAAYGMMGAVPVIPIHLRDKPDAALTQLHAQARAVLEDATTRQKQTQAVPMPLRNNAEAEQVLHELFGPEFRALPAFMPPNDKALNQTFAQSVALQRGNPLASLTWFQRVARVREAAARLHAALLYAEVLNGPCVSFQVGQLPYQDDERWLALEHPQKEKLPFEKPPQGNRLSLVCLTTGAVDFTGPVAGLLIDEWVETVPNTEEVTGLAFHFDAPQPRAPQALLLAVAPEGVKQWDAQTLETTLRETLELAKLRAVDLTALGQVGQYFPAMYVPPDPTTGDSPFV